MEHRAGVLSLSVKSMEKKLAPTNGTDTDGSGYNTPNRSTPMSPTASSMTSVSSKPRFDGAHFFAGHAEAQVPKAQRIPGANEIAALEEDLRAATDALNAANKKQAELSRELSLLRLEKQEMETRLEMDLQGTEDTIKVMGRQLEEAERRLAQGGDLDSRDRSRRELEQKDITLQNAQAEIDDGLTAVRSLIQKHGIILFSRDSSLKGLLSSVGTHLTGVSTRIDAHAEEREEWSTLRRKLEDDVRSSLDKREVLARDLEDARQEREAARKEVRMLELQVKVGYFDYLCPCSKC
jgi:chromosome segregation ATPase